MNVLNLSFNKILMIRKSDLPGTVLMLEDSPRYHNHLGTVHASAQYALAEASSGEILERNFGEWNGAYFPVVRRVEVKYKHPAKGKLYSAGLIDADRAMKAKEELSAKGRALVDVKVKVLDEGKNTTLECTFTWFIAKAVQ
jgi:acyl-coenzyme A thioesterase PaaI-like protein